jgi:chorismate--pyruvate lyase
MNRWTALSSWRNPQRAWVGAGGSLTAWLSGTGQTFSVQVLRQGRRGLHPAEWRALNLPAGRIGYVREVLLHLDGKAVVFARSVTTQAASLGPWHSLRGLGTRPLAEVLFNRMPASRAPLAFARLKPVSPLQRSVVKAWCQSAGTPVKPGALPARRSVFTRAGAPLLVMEVFAAPDTPWCWPGPRRQRGTPPKRTANQVTY